MADVALRLDGVGKRTRTGQVLLDAITLDLPPGRMVALMGGNGAGKSTLLDLVCGLTTVTGGRVEVFGRPPREATRAGWVGGMLQGGGLLPDLTVDETLRTIAALHGLPRPRPATLDPGLARLSPRRVGTLSGGERQWVKWALATMGAPRLLVLDEPTAGMDWQARHAFWEQVRGHRDRGATVLYATHHADEVDGTADLVVQLEAGRLISLATPAQVRAAGSGEVGGAGLFTGLVALAARSGSLGTPAGPGAPARAGVPR